MFSESGRRVRDTPGTTPLQTRGCPRSPSHNLIVQLHDVKTLLQALHRENVEYVLVGGVAMGLHGLERTTADIDLFVRVSETNIDRLKVALRSIWDDPSIDEIRADDLLAAYPVVRYGPPTGDFFIDIMSRIGTEFGYDDLKFDKIDVEGVPVHLATPDTLYRLKRNTLRPIDQIDAGRLKEKFNLKG